MRHQTMLGLAAGCVAGLGAQGAVIVGVTDDNTVITFDSANPEALRSGKPIVGLMSNELVRGIDFRPTTGLLYALGSFGNLYTLDLATPTVATATLRFSVNADADLLAAGGLSGSAFGFDFNPAADFAGANSLRIVSNTSQNLAVNVDTGDVLVATPVSYGAAPTPNIVGQAYTNAVPGGIAGGVGGPPGTMQYAIDSGTDGLVLQAFNAGTLTNVGPLGINVTANVGFDIFTPTLGTNIGYATLDNDGDNVSDLFSIDLSTGAATLLGQVDGGLLVPSIAVVPIPEPTTAALALAALTLLHRSPRRA